MKTCSQETLIYINTKSVFTSHTEFLWLKVAGTTMCMKTQGRSNQQYPLTELCNQNSCERTKIRANVKQIRNKKRLFPANYNLHTH